MEQLDLQALLAKSYEICDALMAANVGKVRTEGKLLKPLFRDDLALFGAYLTGADGVVTDDEAEFIREKLGFAADAKTVEDIRRRRGVAADRSADIPQSLKYAVLADAGKKLSPDPFKRQCAMYFYDTFKVFGQEILARYAREVPQDEVQRFTDYLERMENMLNEYAVWRPVSQKSYRVLEPAENQQTEEERAEGGPSEYPFVYSSLPIVQLDRIRTGMKLRIGNEMGHISWISTSEGTDNLILGIEMEHSLLSQKEGEYDALLILESTTPISFLWN